MSEPKAPITIDCGTIDPPEEREITPAEPAIIDCGTIDGPEKTVTQAEPIIIDCGTIDAPKPKKEITPEEPVPPSTFGGKK